MTALALEVATYEAQLPRLLAEDPDSYVLIKGQEVVGAWPDRDEALLQGYLRFPDNDFLVRKVQPHQPARDVPLLFGRG